MKQFQRTTSMNRMATFGDILLVIIGLNSLVFPSVWHLNTPANIVLIVAGIGVLLIGAYRTARDFLFNT